MGEGLVAVGIFVVVWGECMAEMDREKELIRLAKELDRSFMRWDNLFRNGGSDPNWPDGMGLNLTRGHIISYKKDIEKIVREMDSETSLFGTEFPDIYYRETPPEVPGDLMVKADEIRRRAEEQLALYEQDPNFQYCLENHKKVFGNGETKTTKAAGLSIWPIAAMGKYRKSFESGDLVAMRRDFYGSYEEKAARWAEYAQAIKAFLEADHTLDDNTLVCDVFEDEIDEIKEQQRSCCSVDSDSWLVASEGVDEYEYSSTISHNVEVLSLDEQIENARSKGAGLEKTVTRKEEQLSLF